MVSNDMTAGSVKSPVDYKTAIIHTEIISNDIETALLICVKHTSVS